MEHTVEIISPTERKIAVTVPAKGVNLFIDAVIRDLGANLSLDGFRKGKVPASVIEKRYAEEVTSRATDTLVNNEIQGILRTENLNPINRMQYDGEQVARDKDFSFSFTFEILPEIALPEDLEALEVEVGSPDLSAEEVNSITERILKSMGTLEPIEEKRPAAYGDVVLVDVLGTIDGEPVPGMKTENYLMQLREPAEGQKEGEIDAFIRTLQAGEEGQGTMILPEEYPDPNLRGKEVSFSVKLHAINKEILPEFDDELAKKVGMESAEQLRKVILDQAMNSKLKDVKSIGQQKLLEKVLDALDFPLPESMVSMHLNEYLAENRNYLMNQGVTGDALTKTLEGMKEEGLIQARMQAKSQAFLMALARRENIQVTENDLNRQIMQMAQDSKQDFEKLREAFWQNGVINDLQDRILAAKGLDFMYTKAKKIVVDKDGKPVAPPVPQTQKSTDDATPSENNAGD